MAPRSVVAGAILLAAPASATRASITPVQKVLDMLGGMETKGEKMMEDESKVFATYTEWVDDQTTDELLAAHPKRRSFSCQPRCISHEDSRSSPHAPHHE